MPIFRISGTVGAVITCPLEVVKTRMQSSMYHLVSDGDTLSFRASPARAMWMHIAGTMNALKAIYVNEGVTALWKGMGATIVGVMPSRAIHFSSYFAAKQLLTELNGGQESSFIHLASACSAGVVTSTATNPIWLIKTRMQLQSNAQGNTARPLYRNSLHCLQVVAKTEGIRGLYKGLAASYLGSIEGTIQWVLYERMKRTIATYRYNLPNNEYSSAKASARLTWLDFFLTAASAKFVAAVIAYPHEVLRTRLREDTQKYHGLVRTTMRILQEEGAMAFYSGLTPHLIRVVPNSAIMFFCYEFLVHAYTKLVLS